MIYAYLSYLWFICSANRDWGIFISTFTKLSYTTNAFFKTLLSWKKTTKRIKNDWILLFPSVGFGKATTCEWQSLTLRCGRGRVIRVLYAIYGRRNRHVCAKNKSIKTTNCRARNSKKIAAKTCNGKRTCRLKATNGVFGDPCKGTFKYLSVNYRCESKLKINLIRILKILSLDLMKNVIWT